MRTLKLPILISFLFAIPMVTSAIWVTKDNVEMIRDGREVSATVSKVERLDCYTSGSPGSKGIKTRVDCYRTFVAFRWSDKVSESAFRDTALKPMSIGRQIRILVDPEDPSRVSPAGANYQFIPIFMWILALCFLIPALVLSAIFAFRWRTLNRLKRGGRNVAGRLRRLEPDHTWKIAGQSPWIVEAEWSKPGENAKRIAVNLLETWSNPFPGGVVGETTVRVLFDPEDPSICALETQRKI